jgi:predicted nucleic acid-binding protein
MISLRLVLDTNVVVSAALKPEGLGASAAAGYGVFEPLSLADRAEVERVFRTYMAPSHFTGKCAARTLANLSSAVTSCPFECTARAT